MRNLVKHLITLLLRAAARRLCAKVSSILFSSVLFFVWAQLPEINDMMMMMMMMINICTYAYLLFPIVY